MSERDHGNAPKITIIFVVNGEDVPVDENLHEPLHTAVKHALAASQNTGRPAEEWQVRDDAGASLDQARKIEEYRFKPGVRLYLSLKVGAGGA